jgi:membrane protease YdiL (CAAX protease family)
MEMENSQDSGDGRPLWRRVADFPLVAMVIALALFIGALQVAGMSGKYLPYSSETTEGIAMRAAIAVGLAIALYKLVIARLGEEPRDELMMVRAAQQLGFGLLIGTLLFAAVVGVAAIADVYNIIGAGGTRTLLPVLLSTAVVPGVLEELLFRGILFRWIEQFAGSWAALLLTSLLFGLAHIFNPNATWFSSFAIAMEAGLLLGGAYMLTRSLWMPIGLHAAWNFTQGFIFDVPVSGIDQDGLVQAQLSGPVLLSGGTFGLEASVIALVIATAAGIWLIAWALQRGELIAPWWVRRRRVELEDLTDDPAELTDER